MKFFFFKKKSSKSANSKKAGNDGQQKRKTMVDLNYSITQYLSKATLGEGQNGGNSRPHSPSHSISSVSTQSSLRTIQHVQQEEARGIFRTLEPVWSYLPDQAGDQWIPLASDNQRVLESAFNAKRESKCTISLNNHPLVPTNGPPAVTESKINVYFYPSKSSPPEKSSLNHDEGYKMFSPAPPHKPLVTNGLYLHQNLRRVLVPCWWFEQDKLHMARFDSKNQVLLEALSEGRSTLTLTDASFPVPLQVILEQTDRSLREECCGFMYLNSSAALQPSKNALDPFTTPYKDAPADLHHNEGFLNRRCSI